MINTHQETIQRTATKIDRPALDPHLLKILAEELSADAWQPNRDWTPLAVWNQQLLGRRPHADFRWRFHHLAAQQQLQELEGEASEAESWNGYWPNSALKSLEQNAADADSEAIRYLRELSTRTDRVGWNATILLCQRTPATCQHLAPLLETIVSGDVDSSIVRGQSPENEASPESKDEAVAADDKSEPVIIPADRISLSTRSAAAEAWCLVLREIHDDPLEALSPAGLLLEDPSLELAVRGELYCQLARWISPRQIPRLKNALQASGHAQRAPTEIRRAAVLACLHHAAWNDSLIRNSIGSVPESPWPDTIWNCRYDPDVMVRRYFVQWVSIVNDSRLNKERTFEVLQAMTRDRDLLVQREAIIGLGRSDSQQRLDELHRLMSRTEEPVREAAIRGLCQRLIAEASRYLGDESVAVRRSLAAALADRPLAESVPLLEQLVVDRAPSVQMAAAESCCNWPDQWAVPVLYAGLVEGYLATRQGCFDQLQRRTGTVSTFPLEASRGERQVAAREFFDRHQLTPLIRQLHRAESVLDRATSAEARELQSYEVQQKWDAYRANTSNTSTASLDGLNSLALFNTDDVPALEQLLATASPADQTLLLQVVLPGVSAEYVALNEMTDASVGMRRKAADRLAQLGGERRSLSPFVVRVLRERLLHEQDRIVWQRAFAAIVPDGTDEAAEIALLALNHQWPDIRQLGCEFIIRHPHPSRGLWLLPLLDDPNATVQLAAIRATGLCQNPIVLDGPPVQNVADTQNNSAAVPMPGLRPLLNHAQISIRREAAIAMCRLGDQQAMQVLVQWSRDPDPEARAQAIAAMGESRQGRFIEPLVRLGWTESDAGVQQALLRSLLELVPEERRPEKLSPVLPAGDALKVWMEWWKLQSTPVTTSS
ncbi:MAG: HEAT repeat domain-containing protein [Planctomycetaceae bacterium]